MIDTARSSGLETSEVQDPETGINIEPNTAETFRNWDYNHDGVLDKTEVRQQLLLNNYSPKWRWIAVDIYRAASAR